MYWMLPLNSAVVPSNITLPLKYSNIQQNLTPLPITSMSILTTLLNKLKLLKNLEKNKRFFFWTAIWLPQPMLLTVFLDFWPNGHRASRNDCCNVYQILSINMKKNNRILLNYNSYSIINIFNSYISEKFFQKNFLDIDMIYQGSKYMSWFFTIWTCFVKISKHLFCNTLKYHNWNPLL